MGFAGSRSARGATDGGLKAREVRGEISVTVAASPDALWPFVADTDRVDRAVGLPSVNFHTRQIGDGSQQTIGEYRLGRWSIARWVEHPFEWQRPRLFAVVRDYETGPFLRFRGGTYLESVPPGSRLRSFVEITPRRAWVGPFLRFGLIPVGLRRLARQHRAIAAFLNRQAPQPFPALTPERNPGAAPHLTRGLQRLIASGADATVAARLARFLTEAADEDVAAMRPLELAEEWTTDPRATLDTFVRAAVAGLLELRWELLCPRCRGVKVGANHLRELAMGAYCPSCNLHFIATVDEAIEARFYPNRGIREISIGTYCVGSPRKTLHRVAQSNLQPGQSLTWELVLQAGWYQLSAPQSTTATRLVVGSDSVGASREVTLLWTPNGLRPTELELAAGPMRVHLENHTSSILTVALDESGWQANGATPARLMLLPAFRSLLSTEALAPGFELAVGRVGLLFTDLAGSTALYDRIGDARAFALVGEHFNVLLQPIEAAGGAVVKTIGDAIMAAFPDGRSALSAGLNMQRAIRSLAGPDIPDAKHLLKVGVHVGACFAVTLNERLDYFGGVVNLAARAQNEARGGEVVLTQEVAGEAGPDLASCGGAVEMFEVHLKGFSAPTKLLRIDASKLS